MNEQWPLVAYPWYQYRRKRNNLHFPYRINPHKVKLLYEHGIREIRLKTISPASLQQVNHSTMNPDKNNTAQNRNSLLVLQSLLSVPPWYDWTADCCLETMQSYNNKEDKKREGVGSYQPCLWCPLRRFEARRIICFEGWNTRDLIMQYTFGDNSHYPCRKARNEEEEEEEETDMWTEE